MSHPTLKEFLNRRGGILDKGPIALIFAEDAVEIDTTVRHHQALGFKELLLFAPESFVIAEDVMPRVTRLRMDQPTGAAMIAAVNQVIEAAPGQWLYYCFNAEYLFYPFCESRSIAEMLRFHSEERRGAMLSYVVDLYANDLKEHPNAVTLDGAHLDKTGYYALARRDQSTGHPKERQLDFYGGLRWRYEEHVPEERRKIDRISIFRAQPGLTLRPDFTLSDEEYNTYSCEWHNNLTAAVCSFRTAKALKENPGSTYDIPTFRWHNSVPFEWHSRQLLDLGLMEPGQWF